MSKNRKQFGKLALTIQDSCCCEVGIKLNHGNLNGKLINKDLPARKWVESGIVVAGEEKLSVIRNVFRMRKQEMRERWRFKMTIYVGAIRNYESRVRTGWRINGNSRLTRVRIMRDLPNWIHVRLCWQHAFYCSCIIIIIIIIIILT